MTEERLRQVEAELKITDELLASANETLGLLPECPLHGPCHPFWRDWITKMRAK